MQRSNSLRSLVIVLAASLPLAPLPAQALGPAPADGDAAQPAETDVSSDAPAAESGDSAGAEPSGDTDGAGDTDGGDEAGDGTPTEPEPEPDPGPSQEDLQRQEAATLFREGSMYYELGQYEDAIPKFEAAWKLAPEPQLLFNLGQAHRRWFEIDPQIDHLRNSKTFFINYDKRMKSDPSYSRQESEYVATMIERLDAQIELEEAKKAERERVIMNGPTTADLEEFEKRRIERQRKLEQARRLNGSGIGLIIVGSVTMGVGVGGVVARAAYKAILDNSSGGPDEPSLATADEDSRRRNGFLTGGQIGFGALIAGGVLLATGIGLRVAGGVMEKKTLATPEPKKPEAVPADKNEPPPPKVSVRPGAGGLEIRF